MKKPSKERVDKLLVDRGMVKSRNQAQALVMAGQVCVGDRLIKKPSEMLNPDDQLRLKEGAVSPYVSRGGEKLAGALKHVGLDVTGFVFLDIGISTGGFTDCLLQKGAARGFGIDVGKNQLDWKIRSDDRVQAHEGVNGRDIPEELVPEKVDLVVIDVSFISLTLILSQAFKFLKKGGALLALIKPQFEVEKGQVGKGGIVKDPLLHEQVQAKVVDACNSLGFQQLETLKSPIEGTDGNKEFFIFGRKLSDS